MPEQKFGISQISNPQPKWTKTLFRVVFYVASLGTLAVSTFTKMPDEIKLNVAEAASFISIAAHLFSKMWGIDISDIETNKK